MTQSELGHKLRLSCLAGLWVGAVAAIACLGIITFLRPTPWYINDQEFTWMRNNMTIKWPDERAPILMGPGVDKKTGKPIMVPVGRDAPLWSGGTAFPVALQWGSTLVAALCAAGIYALSKTQASPAADAAATKASKPQRSMLSFMCMKVRHVLAYQLPPRRMWYWWCGGMCVGDALLVSIWMGLAVNYLYNNINRAFLRIAASYVPPPPPPGAMFPPPAPAPSAAALYNIDAGYASKRLTATSKASGEVLRGMLLVMFYPVSRSNFLKWLTGTDFNTLIKYHRWMSWGTLLLTFSHSTLAMIEFGAAASFKHEFDPKGDWRMIAGLISMLAGMAIIFTSTTWFRNAYYWIFFKVHISSAIIFMLFAFIHYKGLVNWILPSLLLYLLDRTFRLWQAATNWVRVPPCDVRVQGSIITLKLTFSKGVRITPGQTVYLRSPRVSLFQSHPFSIAGIVADEAAGTTRVTVHMRAQGDWTRALAGLAKQGKSVWLQIEGPYDTQLAAPPQNDVVVLVAGGIGVTPLLALLQQYVRGHKHAAGAAAPSTVYFVWTARALCELKLLGRELLRACTGADGAGSWLKATLHYTGFEQEQHMQVKAAIGIAPEHHDKLDLSPSFSLPQSDSARSDSKRDGSSNGGDAGSASGKCASGSPASSAWQFAACAVLAFLGAWAALLACSYYDGYYSRTTKKGAPYAKVGTMQFFVISAGTMVPPLLFLLACAAVRRLLPASAPAAADPEKAAVPAELDEGAPLTVLPGYVLAATASLPSAAVESIALQRGRPNIASMLARVRCEHADQQEVAVLVAGPEQLYMQVLEACAAHNAGSDAVTSGPTLVCKQLAHKA